MAGAAGVVAAECAVGAGKERAGLDMELCFTVYLPIMPWNAEHYLVAMRHLSTPARRKTIALLAEEMDEGRAIRIAIAKAKEWAAHHGLPVHDDEAWDGPRGA